MKTMLGLLVFFLFNSAQAETLAQLRTRVDTWLTNKIVNIVIPKQNNYFSNHGRFWQGLISHTTVPTHTGAVVGDSLGDRFDLHPTDQNSSWMDAVPDFTGETWPAAAIIDAYEGPLGFGWVATVIVRYNGVTYERIKGFGPYNNYDHDWFIVDTSP